MRRATVWFILTVLGLAACSSSPEASSKELVIVVNAPLSKTPYIGTTIQQGVQLAVDQINAKGGIDTGGGQTYRLRVEALDNALSPQQALDNVRKAVADKAIAIVDEGTGLDASWQIGSAANLPICIVYQGGVGLVDATARPNVFRVAPTDHGIAFRYAEYLIPKGLRIALMHDDSDYGQQGRAALQEAFGGNPEAVAALVTASAILTRCLRSTFSS